MLLDRIILQPGVDPNALNFDLYNDTTAGFLTGVAQLADGLVAWQNNNDASIFEEDLGDGEGTAWRLREGIERFFITDINNPAASSMAQSTIWIMQDDLHAGRPEYMNHIPGGCNVLYMDGHVDFLKYPTETPVSAFWAQFNEQVLSAF